MSDEQLLFAAGDAAHKITADLKRLWFGGQPITPTDTLGLVSQSRRLHCAVMELDNRARGVKPPKEG